VRSSPAASSFDLVEQFWFIASESPKGVGSVVAAFSRVYIVNSTFVLPSVSDLTMIGQWIDSCFCDLGRLLAGVYRFKVYQLLINLFSLDLAIVSRSPSPTVSTQTPAASTPRLRPTLRLKCSLRREQSGGRTPRLRPMCNRHAGPNQDQHAASTPRLRPMCNGFDSGKFAEVAASTPRLRTTPTKKVLKLLQYLPASTPRLRPTCNGFDSGKFAELAASTPRLRPTCNPA